MERKLIKQGLGGLTIYLPKKWLSKKGLKEGDHIKINEKDNSLSITSEVKGKKHIELDLTDNEESLRNLLTHTYRKGFDVIKINSVDSNTIKEIKALTNKLLLGFELTEKTQNSCTIENISEPTEEKYSVILRRIFLIIQETQDITIQDSEKSFSNFDELQELRDQQDKLTLFCRRLIIKEKTQGNPLLEWELLTFLMHIQHAYYYLYSYASKNKLKLSKEIINLLKNLKNHFNLYYEAYYQKKIENINEINKLKTKYHFGYCLNALEKAKGKETIILSYVREIYRLIQIGTSPILSELLEKDYSKSA